MLDNLTAGSATITEFPVPGDQRRRSGGLGTIKSDHLTNVGLTRALEHCPGC